MTFEHAERIQLLAAPRIGPLVVQRLEQAGLDSFAKLRQVGVDSAVRIVCEQLGHNAWANRRGALAQVLAEKRQA